jgi:hypothetical protein
MNRKTGMIASVITLLGVLGFALSMVFGWLDGSYFSSMLIAWGFVPMVCSFAAYGGQDKKATTYSAVAFSAVYAVLVMIVYFTQLTTVRLQSLSPEAASLLDYGKFGLIFNFDLLGYAFMALATFMIGFSIEAITKADRWLKGLLLVHGVFAISCVIIPMLGIFGGSGGDALGTFVLEFWCAYFTPVCLLAFVHFKRKALSHI